MKTRTGTIPPPRIAVSRASGCVPAPIANFRFRINHRKVRKDPKKNVDPEPDSCLRYRAELLKNMRDLQRFHKIAIPPNRMIEITLEVNQ